MDGLAGGEWGAGESDDDDASAYDDDPPTNYNNSSADNDHHSPTDDYYNSSTNHHDNSSTDDDDASAYDDDPPTNNHHDSATDDYNYDAFAYDNHASSNNHHDAAAVISCLCPTYGRTALLEEAVQCFLMQDYLGESELVICNDLPCQTLVFDHPQVSVVNLAERCANLGEKRNRTASLAKGEWLMTWGDDDIHLPWRISRIMGFVESEGLDFCQEGCHFILDHAGVHLKEHATAGAHVVRRSLFEEVGGLAPLSSGEDVEFNERVRSRIKGLPSCDLPPGFLYRWHSDRPHVSALKVDHYQIFGRRIDDLIAAGKEPSGEVVLQPQWRQPWLELVASAS